MEKEGAVMSRLALKTRLARRALDVPFERRLQIWATAKGIVLVVPLVGLAAIFVSCFVACCFCMVFLFLELLYVAPFWAFAVYGGWESPGPLLGFQDWFRKKLAELIVGDDTGNDATGTYELPVDYSRYYLEKYDYEGRERRTRVIKFYEFAFDHDASPEEVRAEARRLNCRAPSEAETMSAIRRYAPEALERYPRAVHLGGFAWQIYGKWWVCTSRPQNEKPVVFPQNYRFIFVAK